MILFQIMLYDIIKKIKFNSQNGVGKNDYLNEFKYFNPWILHTGSITWVYKNKLKITLICNKNILKKKGTRSSFIYKVFN